MQQIAVSHKISKRKMLEELLDLLIATQDDTLKNLDELHHSIEDTLNYFNQKRRSHEYHSQDL